MTNRTIAVLVAVGAATVAAGAIGITAASAAPGVTTTQTDQPPQGARATVHVTPNPTTQRGQEVTITGNCGGGTGLKQVVGGLLAHPSLVDIRIIDPGPDHYVAKARLAQNIGNGVGPVLVDCGGEAGVTLLVTHV